VLDGTVIGHNMKRHRDQELIRFLNAIEAQAPKRKAIHAIVDDYVTHKRPKVRLAGHPRWTFHFTPLSASWLNAVEGFFARLTRRRLQRGIFRSVDELKHAINRFTNAHPTQKTSRVLQHNRGSSGRAPDMLRATFAAIRRPHPA
jgi:transposase